MKRPLNFIESPKEEAIYQTVVRMTLWNSPPEEIATKLAVNGIPEERAALFINAARGERIATIRGDSLRRLRFGLLFLALGAGVFSIFWYGLGAIYYVVLYLCFGVTGIGLWKTIDGIAGYLMAPHKQGPLEDD